MTYSSSSLFYFSLSINQTLYNSPYTTMAVVSALSVVQKPPYSVNASESIRSELPIPRISKETASSIGKKTFSHSRFTPGAVKKKPLQLTIVPPNGIEYLLKKASKCYRGGNGVVEIYQTRLLQTTTTTIHTSTACCFTVTSPKSAKLGRMPMSATKFVFRAESRTPLSPRITKLPSSSKEESHPPTPRSPTTTFETYNGAQEGRVADLTPINASHEYSLRLSKLLASLKEVESSPKPHSPVVQKIAPQTSRSKVRKTRPRNLYLSNQPSPLAEFQTTNITTTTTNTVVTTPTTYTHHVEASKCITPARTHFKDNSHHHGLQRHLPQSQHHLPLHPPPPPSPAVFGDWSASFQNNSLMNTHCLNSPMASFHNNNPTPFTSHCNSKASTILSTSFEQIKQYEETSWQDALPSSPTSLSSSITLSDQFTGSPGTPMMNMQCTFTSMCEEEHVYEPDEAANLMSPPLHQDYQEVVVNSSPAPTAFSPMQMHFPMGNSSLSGMRYASPLFQHVQMANMHNSDYQFQLQLQQQQQQAQQAFSNGVGVDMFMQSMSMQILPLQGPELETCDSPAASLTELQLHEISSNNFPIMEQLQLHGEMNSLLEMRGALPEVLDELEELPEQLAEPRIKELPSDLPNEMPMDLNSDTSDHCDVVHTSPLQDAESDDDNDLDYIDVPLFFPPSPAHSPDTQSLSSSPPSATSTPRKRPKNTKAWTNKNVTAGHHIELMTKNSCRVSKAKSGKKGKYFCSHCPSSFRTIMDLAQHMDESLVMRPFHCPEEDCPWHICGFPTASEWCRHTRSQHGSVDALGCQSCQKTFTRKDSLKRHVMLVHDNQESRWNRKMRKMKMKREKRGH